MLSALPAGRLADQPRAVGEHHRQAGALLGPLDGADTLDRDRGVLVAGTQAQRRRGEAAAEPAGAGH